MADRSYPVVVTELSEEDGGGFLAFAPDLPGCMADGETQEKAVQEIRSAIGEWIDETVRLGRSVPEPGSAIEAGHRERKELYSALKAQDKLIRKQENLLRDARSEVNRVKAAAAALIEHESLSIETDQLTYWAVLPEAINVAAITRRKVILSN